MQSAPKNEQKDVQCIVKAKRYSGAQGRCMEAINCIQTTGINMEYQNTAVASKKVIDHLQPGSQGNNVHHDLWLLVNSWKVNTTHCWVKFVNLFTAWILLALSYGSQHETLPNNSRCDNVQRKPALISYCIIYQLSAHYIHETTSVVRPRNISCWVVYSYEWGDLSSD